MLRFFERKLLPILILLSIGFFPLVDTEVLGAGSLFPDPNLEQAIRDAIGKPTGHINESDLARLTYLSPWYGYEDISDLTGLERCTSLTGLGVHGNNITDLSPLSRLTNLTDLGLMNNNISDISPLSGLTNLTRLCLNNNNISDISPLPGLTNLTTLWLGGNSITDISVLSGLTNLSLLWLSDNNISDISALSGLTNLTRLKLNNTNISDISVLSGLTNLTDLELGGNNISDISVLSGFANLTWLWLDHNNISDISPLSGLTNLTWLWLDHNNITDIQPLVDNAGLGAGSELDVSYNYLDLTAGSDDMENIQALIDRGVEIEYKPQSGTGGNLQPVANAGPDQTVTNTDYDRQENITLHGSGSDDPDGTIESYVWTENGTQIATGEMPTITLSVGTHTITLIVMDDEGATNTDDVLITVQQARNKLPVANAGPNKTLTDTDSNGSESVTLNGSGSDDPDGTIVSWVWTESGTQIATVETPTVTLSVGTHTITLEVSDDDGATDTDEVRILITSAHAVSAPTTPSGPSTGQVGDSLDSSAGGSTCSQGHSVQYRFDWGDEAYSNWSSTTSASHSYSSAGTYQVKAQARCSVVNSVISSWSEARTVIIGTPSDEHAPTADASAITGQPETMYADTFYTVTAKYYDANGWDDLDICYLRLNHPSKPLTMMWYQADGHAAPWAGEEGERYLATGYTIFSKIDDGYQITWSFRPNDQWPEIGNAIDFGVFASDDSGLTSGNWDYDNARASFVVGNESPDSPTNLSQLLPDGTEIPVGSAVETNSVVFTANVIDPDGDMVKLQVELRQVEELGGSFDGAQGGLKESDLVSSGSTGTYIVNGLVPANYHWRARTVDEHGLTGDWVDFGGNALTEVDLTITNNLAERIDRLLRLGIYLDPYLLTAEGFADSVTTVWLDFTDWLTRTDLTGAYDDLYWLGVDYTNLAYTALIKARRATNAGDFELAHNWYTRYEGCSTASKLAFDAAFEVFDNHVDIAIQIADGIRRGSQAAVKFGLKFVSPTAAEVADYVYLAVDYGIDRALYGKEVALRNTVIEVLVKGLFDYVEYDAIGGSTLANWSKNRVGKSLLPTLRKVFRDDKTMQWAVSKVLEEAGVDLEKSLVESLVRRIVESAGE